MPWRVQNLSQKPSAVERMVGGACYLTGGIAGILYIIIARPTQSQFFRFHFLQAIILSIIFLLLSWSQQILMMFIAGIVQFLTTTNPAKGEEIFSGITMGLGGLAMLLSLVPVYGMIGAFLGKMPEIPLISNVVRAQMR